MLTIGCSWLLSHAKKQSLTDDQLASSVFLKVLECLSFHRTKAKINPYVSGSSCERLDGERGGTFISSIGLKESKCIENGTLSSVIRSDLVEYCLFCPIAELKLSLSPIATLRFRNNGTPISVSFSAFQP
jgi:hypothetical protein